jgi:hypothetical protein
LLVQAIRDVADALGLQRKPCDDKDWLNGGPTLTHGSGLGWIDWHLALSLAAALLGIAGETHPAMRRVEAARVWTPLLQLGARLGLDPPPGSADRPDSIETLLDWGAGASRGGRGVLAAA